MNQHALGKKLISDDEFNSHLQRFLIWTRQTMRGKKRMPPVLGLSFATQTHFDIELQILTRLPAEKRLEIMRRMGMDTMMRTPEKQLAACFIMAEAWAWQKASPEDRLEVVSISGMTIDGRNNAAVIDFERTANGLLPGRATTIPYTADAQLADVLGKQTHNKLLQSFLHGYTLAWVVQQLPRN
ncbi:MAG: hypothetical protein D6711_01165 [Chloroflexi bacterium]|nr:MAG: hypothetical protein D6711_01165 [Chloroflexota bacterium]